MTDRPHRFRTMQCTHIRINARISAKNSPLADAPTSAPCAQMRKGTGPCEAAISSPRLASQAPTLHSPLRTLIHNEFEQTTMAPRSPAPCPMSSVRVKSRSPVSCRDVHQRRSPSAAAWSIPGATARRVEYAVIANSPDARGRRINRPDCATSRHEPRGIARRSFRQHPPCCRIEPDQPVILGHSNQQFARARQLRHGLRHWHIKNGLTRSLNESKRPPATQRAVSPPAAATQTPGRFTILTFNDALSWPFDESRSSRSRVTISRPAHAAPRAPPTS